MSDERFLFLKKITPFNLLPDEVLEGTSSLLQVVTYDRETMIYRQGLTKMKGLDIIVEGYYESFFYDEEQNRSCVEQHKAGSCFGGISILLNKKQSFKTAFAAAGTKVWMLPRKHFRALCKAYDAFFHFFTTDFGTKMLDEEFAHYYRHPSDEASYIGTDLLFSRKLNKLETRSIVSCEATTPIFEAAKKMAVNRVSCLFVTDTNHTIKGFVTDITLRDSVIATCADPHQSIGSIMDPKIVSIPSDAYVYEATLKMFSTKTRYLLIEKAGQYTGFLSRNKLLSEQDQSPMAFIQSVKLAVSVDELKKKWDFLPHIIIQLLNRGVNAAIVNQVISSVADTIAVKVNEQAMEEMGPPPARFIFMVLGSEGRKEQTLMTDQDNAIIYEDKANEQREVAREYFLKFAHKVSEKLDYIGFSYCKGGYMAQNPKWTHSLSHWKRNYVEWMSQAAPETVIQFSTFFDCRYIFGDASIIRELQDFLDEQLNQPIETLFFHMANNALQYTPPLTFFNNIRTFKKDSEEVFDIKKAMTPIVDLVRVYALKNRIFEVNTGERMKLLKEKGVFPLQAYEELNQCYYFLMSMRLKNQAHQIMEEGRAADNYVRISSLTKIERLTLKEIFKSIGNFQTGIKMAFTNNLFG